VSLARAVPALLLLFFSTGARADEAVPDLDAMARAARAHFQAGQAYYKRGDLRRALAEFKAATRDAARPELDYNIGLTYERLGDAARAIEAYQRYLAARPGDELTGDLTARVAALERSVGELVVSSRVMGAAVALDGEVLDAQALGRPLRVTEGRHELTASKEPLLPQHRTVRVEAGQRVIVDIDPREADRGLDRRTRIAIGVGVGAAVVVIVGVALGVYFGTRAPAPVDPGGAAGVVGVRPLALGMPK
jgi:tetratricopeptide (TPR) repeat protein